MSFKIDKGALHRRFNTNPKTDKISIAFLRLLLKGKPGETIISPSKTMKPKQYKIPTEHNDYIKFKEEARLAIKFHEWREEEKNK